jgi:uncharacterized protein YbjT (DUF2867 family)
MAGITHMHIAVAGGTGLIGRLVVDAALAAGHTTTVISRSKGIDLTTGAGLQSALRGISAVIDVSNVTTTSRKKSIAFFGTATKNLINAEQRAGVAHHLALSIIGIDRVDLGYYDGKRRQEELALAGPVPATILRAAQFHEFAAQLADRVKGPFVLVPRMSSQPVAAREVAEALVRLAEQEPTGLAPELAGPEQWEMPDMVRRLMQARGSRRVTVVMPLPGAGGRQLAAGALLPRCPGPRGRQTFEEWLAEIH